jgi:hypothetical protein
MHGYTLSGKFPKCPYDNLCITTDGAHPMSQRGGAGYGCRRIDVRYLNIIKVIKYAAVANPEHGKTGFSFDWPANCMQITETHA